VVNVLAVLYGLFMAVNIAWPRAAVYDPAGGHWYLQWFAEIFVVGVALLGALAYVVVSRSTRAVTPTLAVPAVTADLAVAE
jgi:hypothetical protein